MKQSTVLRGPAVFFFLDQSVDLEAGYSFQVEQTAPYWSDATSHRPATLFVRLTFFRCALFHEKNSNKHETILRDIWITRYEIVEQRHKPGTAI